MGDQVPSDGTPSDADIAQVLVLRVCFHGLGVLCLAGAVHDNSVALGALRAMLLILHEILPDAHRNLQ